MKHLLFILFSIILLTSCSTSDENLTEDKEGEINVGKLFQKVVMDQQVIIDTLHTLYGSSLIDERSVSFKFRDYQYRFYKEDGQRVRSRETTDEKGFNIKDFWYKDRFVRLINGDTVQLEEKAINSYKNAINSVFYFAYLPKALKDPAVNAQLLDTVQIQGSSFYKMLVTFSEEGGGEDYEDQFLYWINKKDLTLDYLAYQYYTEGGGIRFRAVTQRRNVNGIIFQDYANYAPTNENQEFLLIDKAFSEGRLKKVSDIALENIVVK